MLEVIIPAFIISITDADTAKVMASPWLDMAITTNVRIAGIDSPESGGRASCDKERELAAQATTLLKQTFAGKKVFLHHIDNDKYGGRILGNLTLPDGTDWAGLLTQKGYAVHYDGDGPRPDWCK